MAQSPVNIAVLGYPRSGNMWTARLLADALNCPLRGFGKRIPLGAEGEDRPDNAYVVYQTHRAWEIPDGYKIVLARRDPRDVAVSAWKYWELESLYGTIVRMRGARWPLTHGDGYLNFHKSIERPYILSEFAELANDTPQTLRKIIGELGVELDDDIIDSVVEFQSFENRVYLAKNHGDEMPLGKDAQIHHLRKGIVGDWYNYFDADTAILIDDFLGDWMSENGYTQREWLDDYVMELL